MSTPTHNLIPFLNLAEAQYNKSFTPFRLAINLVVGFLRS